MSGIDFDFNEYPTLLQLATDPAYVRVVIGPAGSAKTSGLFAYALYLAMQQFPGKDGVRRTRLAVLRQTYQQLAKNTVPTIRTVLGGLVSITDGKPPSGRIEFPLRDGTHVQMEFVFYALESQTASTDVLGAEFTIALFDEISSMVDEELVLAFISRLGRYPSTMAGPRNEGIVCALGATNGPNARHWLADWANGKRDEKFNELSKNTGRKFFSFFQQPSGLLKLEDGTYVPNPQAENVKNLPGGYAYYFAQLMRSEEHIIAYVMGRFVPLVTGKVVYTNFKVGIHTTPYNAFMARWHKSGRIGLTFDFGRTPVCLAWIDMPGGGIVVFDEFMAEDLSVDGFWVNIVRPRLMERYPACVAGRSGYVTGDPSGMDQAQAVDKSPYSVLQEHGLNVEFPGDGRKDSLQPRIEATRQRMSRLDVTTGAPMLMITDNCKYLIDAVASGYVYTKLGGKTGGFSDVPTKSHVGWVSDLVNALEYLCVYRRSELEPAVPSSALPRKITPLLGG